MLCGILLPDVDRHNSSSKYKTSAFCYAKSISLVVKESRLKCLVKIKSYRNRSVRLLLQGWCFNRTAGSDLKVMDIVWRYM